MRFPAPAPDLNNWEVMPLPTLSLADARHVRTADGLDDDVLGRWQGMEDTPCGRLPKGATLAVSGEAGAASLASKLVTGAPGQMRWLSGPVAEGGWGEPAELQAGEEVMPMRPIALRPQADMETAEVDPLSPGLRFDDSIGDDYNLDEKEREAQVRRQGKQKRDKKQQDTRGLLFSLAHIEHVPYPITHQIIPIYPGISFLRASELARERSFAHVFDSTSLWSWLPNIFSYNQSTLTMELKGPEDEETLALGEPEAAEAADDGDGEGRQQETIEPIVIEFRLPAELGIKQILSQQDALLYLQKAMISHDTSSLFGCYMVCMWNIALNSWDLDGIDSVSYSPDRRMVSVKVKKTGPLAIVSLKYAALPYRGWALIPQLDRGEGQTLDQLAEGIAAQADVLPDPTAQQPAQAEDTAQTGSYGPMGASYDTAAEPLVPHSTGRISFYHVRGQGALRDAAPTLLELPKQTQRALLLRQTAGVSVHSVILKLALPSGVIIHLRILPEGYELLGFSDIAGFDSFAHSLNPNDYLPESALLGLVDDVNGTTADATTDASAGLQTNQLSRPSAPLRLPKKFANVVFPSTIELLSTLARCGIFLSFVSDVDLRSASLKTKTARLDSELARQLAMAVCASIPDPGSNDGTRTSESDLAAPQAGQSASESPAASAGERQGNHDTLTLSAVTDAMVGDVLSPMASVAGPGLSPEVVQHTRPLLEYVLSSPWNRNLPDAPAPRPAQNQFQLCEETFVESVKRSRGWLNEQELAEYEKAEAKRAKAEKKRLEQEAKKPGSTVPPPKKKEQKIEKGMPPPLGPGNYGITADLVAMRTTAVENLERFIRDWTGSVGELEGVRASTAACFLVATRDLGAVPAAATSTVGAASPAEAPGEAEVPEPDAAADAGAVPTGEGSPASTLTGSPLSIYTQEQFAALAIPPKKQPPAHYDSLYKPPEKKAKQAKKGKKGATRVNLEQEEDSAEGAITPRVTQTKPYDASRDESVLQEAKRGLRLQTLCVTEGNGIGEQMYSVRSVAVPLAPNTSSRSEEEFCPLPVAGTESHSSVVQMLLGGSMRGVTYDPVLVVQVFRLVKALRLGTVG